MALLETLIGPIASLIDKIIPDPQARERAKLELLRLEGSQEMEAIKARLAAIVLDRLEELVLVADRAVGEEDHLT